MAIHPVILCGGSGTRLWPASRPERPKQFAALVGAETLFEATLARFDGLEGAAAPIIVAGRMHEASILAALDASGRQARLLIEPEGRDSAPAIAAAAALILEFDPEGVAAAVAADHHIPDGAAFRAAVSVAAAAARGGLIATFGVTPTGPSTAYGYLRPGEALEDYPGVRRLEAFAEKPERARAEAYVASGYLWNSGNFVFRADVMLAELDRYAAGVAATARTALDEAVRAPRVRRLSPRFVEAPKISIDYAVMEKTDRAAVAPVDYAWSDLGAWDAVLAASPRDAQGNAAREGTLLLDAAGCLVRAPRDVAVALVGVSNLAVVAEGDALLICALDAAQAVKTAAARFPSPAQPTPRQRLAAEADALDAWLTTSALPLWWALGADHVGGGFHEALDQGGRAVTAPRRTRVQARQIYVYAMAARAGWSGPARAAVAHGLSFLLDAYRRPDGLFRATVGGDGHPLDETATLYNQAFVLLALAVAREGAADAAALEAEADRLLQAVRTARAHPAGGFVEDGALAFQANPHMHLLEAALAWEEAGGGATWRALADEIAGLALSCFIDGESGALREFFDADWRPAPGPDGRRVEPGHQFEWAWLLERWGRLRQEPTARAAALRLYEVGADKGVDRARSVAIDELDIDLSPRRRTARLWPQTERLKAALIMAEASDSDRNRFIAEAADAATGLRLYLDTPVRGLWRDKLREDGGFVDEAAPASSFYHIVAGAMELRRVRAALAL